MTLFEQVTSELEALVAQGLGLPADAVYTSPEPQAVPRNGLEAWLEPLRPQQPAAGVTSYLFALHLKERVQDQPAGTLGPAAKALLAQGNALRAALDGRRPFADRVPQLIGLALDGGELTSRDQELSLELDLKAVVHD